MAPDADPGEEVALGVTTKVIGFHVLDAAVVDIARCDVSGLDEFAQPCGGFWVMLIVVVHSSKGAPHAFEGRNPYDAGSSEGGEQI